MSPPPKGCRHPRIRLGSVRSRVPILSPPASPDPSRSASAEYRRFEFRRCLGVGGFGEVYLARMTTGTGISRDVAVKLLLASLDPGSALRMRDEARLLGALNHRAILQIYDLIQLDGRAALVTEFVDGLDLTGIIAESGALDAKLALEVVGEVAGALHAALVTLSPGNGQPLGLVHRDIKPANIRLARSGGVKLLDFGIAVSTEIEREAKTGTGIIVGTMGYLAPERVSEVGVQPPSDVYALGCVLYEAVMGEKLYAGLGQSQTLRIALHPDKHEAFLLAQLARVGEVAGAEVRALMERTLAYEAADRFTSAELEQACDELATSLPGANLRRWARERSWTEPEAVGGSLEGRTIETVATLGGGQAAQPVSGNALGSRSGSVPLERPPVAHKRPAWLLPVAVVGAGIVALGVAGAVVVGAYALQGKGGGELATAAPIAASPAQTVVAPANPGPSEAVVAAPVPVAEPAKPAAKAVAEPRAAAVPTPAAPKPAAPREAPPVESLGNVQVAGGVPVELRSGAKTWRAGPVPAGGYAVWADFGAGFVSAGSVTVTGGATVTVKCSAMMMACKAGVGG